MAGWTMRPRATIVTIIVLSCIALLAMLRTHASESSSSVGGANSATVPVEKYVPPVEQPRVPKMLYSIALYNLKQVMYTYNMLDGIRDICEAGYDVHVVLDVHDPITDEERRAMEKTMYCARTRSTVPLEIIQCENCRLNLTTQHKQYMFRELDNYDLFAYSEDDMVLSLGNLKAYLQALDDLKTQFPESWLQFWPGFLRYENPIQCHSDRTIRSYSYHGRIVWEHPAKDMGVLRLPNLGDYLLTRSPHQAMWVLTRDELAHLQSRCQFLTSTHYHNNGGVRIWVSSFQHQSSCNRLRLIPVDRLRSFIVHHAPDKNFKRPFNTQSFTLEDIEDIIRNRTSSGAFATSPEQALRFVKRGLL